MKPEFLTIAYPEWMFPLPGSVWLPLGVSLLLGALILAIVFVKSRKRKRVPNTFSVSPEKRMQDIDYDQVIAAIRKQNGRARSLLLAATSLNDLPVTVAVTIAARLAERHKCLLVDLDFKRNAIARVFDLEPASRNGGAAQAVSHLTTLENVFVWPAHNFEVLRQMNLRMLLENAAKKYDYVLIYAPYLTTLPDRRQIASCSRQAIAFTGNNGVRLRTLLSDCSCTIIKEI
jgi:hypothetical protein